MCEESPGMTKNIAFEKAAQVTKMNYTDLNQIATVQLRYHFHKDCPLLFFLFLLAFQ